jgi:hypothetical protein
VGYRNGQRAEAAIEEVAAFASDEHNPGNRLGVTSLDITLPGAPEFIRLLDTPGVGAFATASAAEAFAWLPRCDLGLVLIAAGAAFEPDDLALISGLDTAGVEVQVLLSKADLLDELQLQRVLEHLRFDDRPAGRSYCARARGVDRDRRCARCQLVARCVESTNNGAPVRRERTTSNAPAAPRDDD